MSSFLGWVDHDPEHEASVLRALGAAGSQDARDELGLAGIRDSFADTFFPGLSTIQRRVRYFLFVQWCCEIAARQTSEERIVSALRDAEVALIRNLSRLGQRQGVIGIDKPDELERMPSEIYWNGLLLLDMRRLPGPRQRWPRRVLAARLQRREEPSPEDHAASAGDSGFDLSAPRMPKDFPSAAGLDFELTGEEAAFLRSRLANACVDPTGLGLEHNLIAAFSRYRRRTLAPYAWEHPAVGTLPGHTSDLLQLAAAFSRLMHGAMSLYHRAVAELALPEGGSLQRYESHAAEFVGWIDQLQAADVSLVRDHLREVIPLARQTRHTIQSGALAFVNGWCRLCESPTTLAKSEHAVRLVSNRERHLKARAGTSRIQSPAARRRWQGGPTKPLDYRWDIARWCLNDLAAAR